MNPFQLQAEFARQWFGLATSMASAAMAASTAIAEQMTSGWKQAAAPTQHHSAGTWPTSFSPSYATPATTPMPTIFNAFGMPSLPTTLPMLPWMSAWGWNQPSPAPVSLFPPLTVTWALPWTAAWPFMPWSAGMSQPSNPGAALMEQVATSYRTASGYAAAAVMGPFGAALDPRTYGQPWWHNPPKNGFMN